MPERESQQDFVQCDGYVDEDRRVATRDQLLAQVLGETLRRRTEATHELTQSLKQWRLSLTDASFGQSMCTDLVVQVLRCRLGSEAEHIPAQLFQEVGAVLWNNPSSRERIERLWNALGTPA